MALRLIGAAALAASASGQFESQVPAGQTTSVTPAALCHSCMGAVLQIHKRLPKLKDAPTKKNKREREAMVYEAMDGFCNDNVFTDYTGYPPEYTRACYQFLDQYNEDNMVEGKLIAGGDDSTSIAFEICDEVCGMFPPQERVTYYRPPMGEGTANLLEDMDPEKGDKNPSGSGGAPAAKAAGGASADSSKQKAKKEKSKKSKAKAAAPPPSGGMGGRPDMNMKQPDLSHLTPEQRAKYEVTGPGGKKGYYVDQDGNPLEMDPMFMNMPHVGPNGEQLGPGGPPPGGPMGGPPGGGAFPPPPPPPGAGKKTKKGAKKGGNKKKAGKKDAAAAPTEGGAKSGGKASDEL